MGKKKDKEPRPPIPANTKARLWLASGGRCQFKGCNKALWSHSITRNLMNKSYIAHIYAFSPEGPRYDKILSPQLETDYNNLMLMCDECHRLIDAMPVKEYTAETLIQMKKDHEARIELLTGIQPNKMTHVIMYGAKVGKHDSPLRYDSAVQAVIPQYYPLSSNAIELGMKNTVIEDSMPEYWNIQEQNLCALFKKQVEYIKENDGIQHYSIFALAPQPLLIKLGTLLNDIYSAEVYQLHREPSTWAWQNDDKSIEYELVIPEKRANVVALKIELSATITDDRLTDVMGIDVDIWSIKIEEPYNDFLQSRHQLKLFREFIRKAFDKIKAIYGQDAVLNIFPAMPVSTAIELGRAWMPKADMSMLVYDQNRTLNKFIKTLKIK
ncbi:SAVED domain-containing protein [Halosquirtibacter xylanolyticus]|uniref:SAVED domain-containing protein n=1 Tax=Halosquirtibacter xylanolyticus TaxID=3374599 RepID=UPI003748D282|nr:SAVED domain-containing protein [Prolixibacteraceae bacterium]